MSAKPSTRRSTAKKATKDRNWAPLFLRHLSTYGNVTEAVKKTRIDRGTAYKRRERDEAFRAAWEKAVELGTEALEDEARRRAFAGCDEGVFYQGKRVAKLIKYSDTLLIFLLKAHKPEKYRETTRSENVTVDLSQLTDDQLARLEKGEPLAAVLRKPDA